MTDTVTGGFDYAPWVEDALRGVVRRALLYTADHGLFGDHHFYISFRTTDDGVHIADHLRARYPTEMTIVLQHQFWELDVGEEAFTVSLRFAGRLTPLRIPYAAITAFGDPSVNFGLQFSAPAVETPQEEPTATRQEGNVKDGADAKDEAGEVIAFDAFRKK